MRIAKGALIALMLVATMVAFVPGAGAVAGEPDRDGDGFGDETEDACPWNPAVQVECPPVRVKVAAAKAGAQEIAIRLGVSSEAQIQVFGQVSWQVRQPHGDDRGLIVGLSAGAPRTVAPGALASSACPSRNRCCGASAGSPRRRRCDRGSRSASPISPAAKTTGCWR